MSLSFPTFPSVPSMAQEAQDFVEELLTESREKATEAVDRAIEAIAELKDVQFPDEVPTVPTPPVITTSFDSQLGMDLSSEPDLGEITVTLPNVFTADDIEVPDIAGAIPEYSSLFQGLTIPNAPSPGYVALPDVPSITTDIDVPSAPTAAYGDLPILYALNLPTFTPPILTAFDGTVPTFDVDPPSPNVAWIEPAYEAWIADELKTALQSMLAGGTGIPTDVERAIWERDRGRLDIAALADIQGAEDEYGARGFELPSGPLFARVRDIVAKNKAAIAEASRNVAIKQADLEQANRQFAVKTGAEIENMFVQIFLSTTQRSFDIAKYAVEARINIFNAQIAAFNVEQQIFAQRIEKFKADLQYALSLIEAYKAQLQAEAVKGDINKSLIDAYKSKVQSFQAQVEAYRAVVDAATARGNLEKNKVELYRAEIEGARVRLEAKKSEYDAYDSQIKGEVAKTNLEESNARAYTARVQAISAKSDITVKQADVALRISDQKLKSYLGNLEYLGQLSARQLQAIQARSATLEAAYRRDATKFEVTKAGKQLAIQAQIETGRNLVAYYAAQGDMWKADVQRLVEYAKINSEGIRAAGQIAATLAAGSMAGTSVSAAFGGSVNRGESTSQSETYGENKSEATNSSSTYTTGTTTQHIYNHEA